MIRNKTIPPKLANRFLRTFLRHDFAEEVEGDLEEKFYSSLKSKSSFHAKLNYWLQVINYLRPFAIRKWKSSNTIYLMMYGNYFKIALRNTLKNKVYSSLNIAGLSIGMTVTILIGLWIWDELSFDKVQHEYYSTIAQVLQNVSNNGEIQTWSSVPYPLAEEIRRNYSEDFDEVVMGTNTHDYLLTVGNKKLTGHGAFYEARAPHLFTLTMLAGNRDGLINPNSILISKSLAIACFGDEDVINKTMRIGDDMDVKVTGVFKDFPSNSSFPNLQFLAPWKLFANAGGWIKNMEDPWRPNAFQLFVQMSNGSTFEQASLKIRDEKLKHVNKELAKKNPQLFLWPMSKWHLYSDFKNGKSVGGRIQYVWMFGIIGGFVLLLACINFMNLCTARSERRAKEIGIRKSVGSLRMQLIHQFFSESFFMVLVSLAFALLFAQLLLPFFNEVSSKSMEVPWQNPVYWIICLTFCVITGLIAGSYPALYLSSFQAVRVLKGAFKANQGTTYFRRVLVMVQFSVSVTLIIGTIVVFRQIQFAKDRPIGYNSDGLISIHMMNDEIHKQFNAFRNELVNTGSVVAIAESSSAPTETWATSSGFDWEGKDPNLSIDFPFMNSSADYGKAINWEIIQGRDFSEEFASDSMALILNEAALKYMGLKEPIGATIRWFGDSYHVIGVVKDLIMQSPYEPVRPTIFTLSRDVQNMLIIKINPNVSATSALAKVEEMFKKFNPIQPFEYQFVDDEYGRKFGNEERVGKLASAFAGLAIFISCLGIFGLAAFVAEQRTKEVGIRKVLGASMMNVWQLLSKEFILLVILSCFIAMPIGYYVLKLWLKGFTYRTEISWWIFASAFLAALSITLLTVSTQAIRAAMTNPVKSLRSE
jgi:ABC-type antimicrobial peptide transport system permease subunit